MKTIPFLLLGLLSIPLALNATESTQPDHYCDDAAAWQQWDKLLNDNPTDDGINSLYAFRVGLCSMVKTGQIETSRAIRLFEGMREAVLKGMYDSEQERKDKGI